MKTSPLIPRISVACPECGALHNHVLEWDVQNPVDVKLPTLKCHQCKIAFTGSFSPVFSTMTVGKCPPQDQPVPVFRLVELPPQEHSVFFLLKGRTYFDKQTNAPKLDDEYYINSHSCPTNWMDGLEALADVEGADPHGLLEWRETILVETLDAITAKWKKLMGHSEGSSDTHTDTNILHDAFPIIQRTYAQQKKGE